jgi:dienelactone hydrolase
LPDTHCLPSGSLGTGENPVPAVPANATVLTPGGNKRGVVVLLHGLSETGEPSVLPPPLIDYPGPWVFLTLAQELQNDGWVVAFPQEVADPANTDSQGQAIQIDIANDAGNGARLLAANLHWWDHVVEWIADAYGPWPIVVVGGSWGGWIALEVAINRAATLTGYCAHHPVSNPSLLNPSVVPGDWSDLDTTGMNVGPDGLDGVHIPGLLGWGTADTIIDYPQAGDTLTPAIYTSASGAGAPVTANEQAEGHIMGADDITAITSWFGLEIDPRAPAVY